MLVCDHLICDFPDGPRTVRGLSLASLSLPDAAAAAVIGPSGSGKSTLFRCLSGLIVPTAGRISAFGAEISSMDEAARTAWRASHVGFIFQEARLLPYLTVMENVLLAAEIAGKRSAGLRGEAEALLSRVGLAGYGGRRPARLSGGERQRVSFVRAVLLRPALLLADEPTASLDTENSRLLIDLLLAYQNESGTMLLCATHDPAVQARFETKIFLTKGGAPC